MSEQARILEPIVVEYVQRRHARRQDADEVAMVVASHEALRALCQRLAAAALEVLRCDEIPGEEQRSLIELAQAYVEVHRVVEPADLSDDIDQVLVQYGTALPRLSGQEGA